MALGIMRKAKALILLGFYTDKLSDALHKGLILGGFPKGKRKVEVSCTSQRNDLGHAQRRSCFSLRIMHAKRLPTLKKVYSLE